MKKPPKPKVVNNEINLYEFAEEQVERLDKHSRPDDAPMQTVLPLKVQDAMLTAQQGDVKAWGVLYSAAAALMRANADLPEPLKAMLAQRLEALGTALSKPPKDDSRKGVLDAVAPHPKGTGFRLVGSKVKVMTADLVAQDVLAFVQAGMSQKAASRKVSSLLPLKPNTGKPLYSPETLEVAAKRVKKQPKSEGE